MAQKVKSKQTENLSNMKSETKTNEIKFVLEKQNYILLLIGFVIIVIGFILMVGGGTDDPAVFSDKIFSFRRITLAPIVVLLGFAIEVYAIMKKPSKKTEKTETESKE